MKRTHPIRGFTLFIALIMTAVMLSVGLALLSVSYRQVMLASSAKNSISAFYNADGALECALYWDSQLKFDYYADYTNPLTPSTLTCDTVSTNNVTFLYDNSGTTWRTRKFTIPCPGASQNAENGIEGGDGLATVFVYKSNTSSTTIYADGYDSCSSANPSRTESGLKVVY